MLSVLLSNPEILAQKYESSSQMLSELIKYIYENTSFDGIIINKKIYTELPNKWYHINIDKPTEQQVNQHVCDGYWDCDLKRKSINSEYEFSIDYGPYDRIKLNKKLFKNNTVFYIVNTSGKNDDHRGSDHFEYKIPYVDKVRLINPTLKELIYNLYFIKSHKCDKWYELYCDTEFSSKKYKYNDVYTINIVFDHGS
jgi:hypothetical protein